MGRNVTREIRVGSIIILALAIIVSVVFTLGGDQKIFGRKAKYQILFNSTYGLYKGDPVLLTGVEIGNVSKIGFPDKIETLKILVEIEVNQGVCSRIREDTKARIGSASLVYGKVVELSMGSPDTPPLPEGAFIETVEKGGFSAVVDTTSLALEELRSVISKIDRGEGIIGALLTESDESQAMVENLALSTQRLSNVLGHLDEGRGPLGSLLSDSTDFQQTVVDFQIATEDLKEIVENLRDNRSVLGRLINDAEYGEILTDDLARTIHSLASITAKIDTGRGSIGGLINDRELYTALEDVLFGIRKSSIAKWAIRNRRKAGEKERQREEEQKEKEKEMKQE